MTVLGEPAPGASHPGLLRDALAGVAVAGILLPEGVAYAGIAGLPPLAAMTAAIGGTLAYAAVGRSRFAVISPTSSSAALLAASTASLAGAGASVGALAAATTLLLGLLLAGAALFRLGGLAGFVARPVLRGFAFGLAVSIVTRQALKLAGLHGVSGAWFATVAAALPHLGEVHLASCLLGLVALGALIGLRRVPGMPASLVVLAAGTALGWMIDLPAQGIALAGPITLAWPRPSLPTDLATWERLAELAAPLALIVFAESWGTIRALALAHGDPVAANRELAALGLANVVVGLANGMPVGAGFSAGMANAGAGAQSRGAAAAAALALALLLLGAGPLLARLPEPVLAAVVITALLHALSPAPLLRLVRINRDQWVALAATLGVLTLGVLDGMLLAVALSLLALLQRLSRPGLSELGQLGHSHDFVDRQRHPDASAVPGCLILRPNAPLFFANVESVLSAVRERWHANGAATLVLSLEESADCDSTAAEALIEFAAAARRAGRQLVLARAHDALRELLVACGATELAKGATYSVADAAFNATTE